MALINKAFFYPQNEMFVHHNLSRWGVSNIPQPTVVSWLVWTLVEDLYLQDLIHCIAAPWLPDLIIAWISKCPDVPHKVALKLLANNGVDYSTLCVSQHVLGSSPQEGMVELLRITISSFTDFPDRKNTQVNSFSMPQQTVLPSKWWEINRKR